jgi:hypothetical protein
MTKPIESARTGRKTAVNTARRGLFGRGQKRRKEKMPGGSAQRLKRLNSAKPIQAIPSFFL